MEIEDRLTVTGGSGDNGGKGRKIYRNNSQGSMDNNKEGWKQGREVGRAGVVGRAGGKRQKTLLEQQ